MSEREQPPEVILRLKEAILQGFAALPGEHQATMVLVMLKNVLEGAWGEWTRQALRLTMKVAERPDPFALPIITRADLEFLGFSPEETTTLSEGDLRTLAIGLFGHYEVDGDGSHPSGEGR